MIQDNNLEFIRTRIYDIRTALLYSLSDDIIKLPTSLISVLKVDDKGQIWFLMNRPQQAMEKDEQKFPARLQFYRKGKPFYMQVTGRACLVENMAGLNHLFSIPRTLRKAASHNLIVVRLKMDSVEYHEQASASKPMNTARRLLQYIYTSVFAPSNYYQTVYEDNSNEISMPRYNNKSLTKSPFGSLTTT
jgi:hypothetical protein